MIRKFTEFILYSHIFIGLGAFALNYVSQIFIFESWENPRLSLFCFGACWFSYLFHRFSVYEKRDNSKDNQVMVWTQKHLLVLRSIFPILGLALLYQFFQFDFHSQLLLAFVGFVSFTYSNSFFGFTLRNIPFLKIFLISFNWAACCVLLIGTEYSLYGSYLLALLATALHAFLFIFVLTILFDIRDIEFDQKDQLPTIPSKFGIKRAKLIAYVIATVWWSGCSLLLGRSAQSGLVLPLSLLFIILVSLIYKSEPNRGEMYYLGFIDGCIVLWGLLVYLFHTPFYICG